MNFIKNFTSYFTYSNNNIPIPITKPNEKFFPLKNINIYLNENDILTNINLKSLHNIFIDLKIKIFEKNKHENIVIKNKENFKIKLFNFLYEITIDQIFSGNDFIYITDYDIYWDMQKEKLSYSSMEL
jgi:hypothetical protein